MVMKVQTRAAWARTRQSHWAHTPSLMKALIACARDAGYVSMDGAVLSTNAAMLALTARLGFVAEDGHEPDHTVKMVLALGPANENS